ncbi:MAG TPA: hotdog domain-containing protein [Acidimicrobiia bacterium]|nr:hotdog domain-containing protein [Acidimicrobiia bacterium]
MTTEQVDHLYGHLGMTSARVSDTVAEGTMPIGDDIRTPGGIRAALPALLVELITGQFAISLGLIVLSDMTLHLRHRGVGIDALRGEVRLVRTGRSRVIGVGRVEDLAEPSRVVGFGTVSIAVLGPLDVPLSGSPPVNGRPTDPPPILDAMGMTIRDDGACELAAVHAGVWGPQNRLHGGAQQLMAEAASLAASSTAAGTDRVVTGDFSVRFLYPALHGPFVATPTVVDQSDDDVLCRVDVVDTGNDDRLTSIATIRTRILH